MTAARNAARDAARASTTAYRIYAAIAVAYIASMFFRQANAVIAPELMHELSLSPEIMGTMTGVFFLAFAVAQLPTGVLLDRFGARATMSMTLTLAVAGAVLFALAHTAGELLVARFLIGAGGASGLVGGMVVIGRWFPPRRFAGMSAWLFAIGGIGNLLATTPLALAVAEIGWRGSFVAMAGFTALCAVVLFAVVRDAPPGDDYHSRAPETPREILRGLRDVLTYRSLWYICAIQFVSYAVLMAVIGLWGGPYLADVHGLNGVDRGNVLLAMTLSMLIGVIALGSVEKILRSRRRAIIAAGSASAAILLVLALAPDLALWQATALLMALSLAGSYVMLLHAHARAILPDRVLGRGLTLQNMALMVGVFAIQASSGFIVGAFETEAGAAPETAYRAVFGFLAAITVAALAVYRNIEDVDPYAAAHTA